MAEAATKIIATIGPSSAGEDTIHRMILAGMDAARLNFSHGTHEDHRVWFGAVRRASSAAGQPVAIIQDLQGPKLRVGTFPGRSILLNAGSFYTLTAADAPGGETLIPVERLFYSAALSPGQRVLFADGRLEARIVSVDDSSAEIEVTSGGILKNNQGINLPGAHFSLPALTEKDKADLRFGLELGVDAIAMSFIRSAEDLRQLRSQISEINPLRAATAVIAKLERPEALENLNAILAEADGVMVARGDLGVEMNPEDVPVAQKTVIEAANQREKIVITATQMLESMIDSPSPTRAEASDVANAIFDGTDAVMLSGETAIGQYPVETVRTMRDIIQAAERHLEKWGRRGSIQPGANDDGTFFASRAASELAKDPRVRAIAAFTETGRTARLISKSRPSVPILGFTTREPIFHQMQLEWGISPYLIDPVHDFESMIGCLEETILREKMLASGDHVVIVCGFPLGDDKPPNLALLYTLRQRTS